MSQGQLTGPDSSECSNGGTGGTADFFGWNSASVIQMLAQQAKHPNKESVSSWTEAACSEAKPGAIGHSPAEDDVDSRLEAMVEDLAGVNSFTLLEDAFSKVDAARTALSKVLSTESGLRTAAPTFTPGEMWTGRQVSNFVD